MRYVTQHLQGIFLIVAVEYIFAFNNINYPRKNSLFLYLELG